MSLCGGYRGRCARGWPRLGDVRSDYRCGLAGDFRDSRRGTPPHMHGPKPDRLVMRQTANHPEAQALAETQSGVSIVGSQGEATGQSGRPSGASPVKRGRGR